MRVAAIYDIHGNLPALEAVLQDIRRAGVDLVVVGGDVLPGPMPLATLSCLLDLEIPSELIQGNGEVAVLAEMSGTEAGTVPQQYREIVQWSAGQLQPEHQEVVRSWPKTLRVEISGLGEVLFCHATPRSDTEVFTRLTPEDRLSPVFADLDVPLVVCGHTHMQFDRTIGRIRVVNAGSVGMPFGEAGADWLLLGPDVAAYDKVRRARGDVPQVQVARLSGGAGGAGGAGGGEPSAAGSGAAAHAAARAGGVAGGATRFAGARTGRAPAFAPGRPPAPAPFAGTAASSGAAGTAAAAAPTRAPLPPLVPVVLPPLPAGIEKRPVAEILRLVQQRLEALYGGGG